MSKDRNNDVKSAEIILNQKAVKMVECQILCNQILILPALINLGNGIYESKIMVHHLQIFEVTLQLTQNIDFHLF